MIDKKKIEGRRRYGEKTNRKDVLNGVLMITWRLERSLWP